MDKKLNILNTTFKDLYIIEPNSFNDNRGVFSRIFCVDELKVIFNCDIKQINHSVNHKKGTTRGLHFQYEPHAEIKIIQCLQGSIYDIVVDIRKNSPTFLKTFNIILTKKNKKMLYIPKGFAHGFQTLEDNTEILYLHSNLYTPKNEGALNIKDPLLNIKWPLDTINLTQKDTNHPFITNEFQGIVLNEV